MQALLNGSALFEEKKNYKYTFVGVIIMIIIQIQHALPFRMQKKIFLLLLFFYAASL